MRRILLTAITVIFFSVEFASAQIGIGTTTPNPAAQLDVSSANKGLLMPRVALVAASSWSPLTSTPTEGMILYNTATSGTGTDAVAPGFYYWANSMWIAIAQVPSTSPGFQVTALNCQAATPATGTYEQNTPILAGASKTVTVTPNAAGAYSVSTNTVAGVTFSAAGTFTAGQAGIPQNILLLASGTPASSGLKTFIVTAGAQVCTFNINFTTPAVFNCGSLVSTLTQAQLVSGNSYSGTVTLPYTSGNGNAYPANTLTSNGLTLASTAGTYLAGGGSIVYTLSGTYSGTGGGISFTLPESGCVVFMGGATFNANSLGCGNNPGGTYALNTPMTATNTKTISFTANTIGYYSASTNTVNGVTFSGTGFIGNIGSSTVTLTATGTPAAAGLYNFTVTVGGLACTFPITFTAPATFNCGSVSTTFTGNLVNGTVYSGTVTEPYTAGNNTAYSALTVGPQDGLTLSASAGTYLPAGGTITYTISGTYTGPSEGIEIFTLPESGCTVSLGAATYSAASLNCTGQLLGTYLSGIATTAANTKTISISVGTIGGYTLSSTANGVTFSGSGVFFATGGPQTILLTASGTPISTGSFNYTVILGGQTCTFGVVYTAPVTALCSGTSNTITAPLVSATTYTGTVTVPYITGNGQAYSSYAVGPSAGLTLTRVPGTYSPAGGNVVYNISGTYTGPTNASQSFNVPEGCTVLLGQPDLIAGSLSCAGALNGIFQVGISATGNTKVISFANNAGGAYSITSTNNAGISFSASGTLSAGGSQSITLTANGTPNNFGTFTYTITIDGQSCSFTVTIAPAVIVNCSNIVSGLPTAPLVSGTAYTGTVTEPYTAGNGQIYNSTVLSSNGLTLTRVAGTYAAGGSNVLYNIGGTYSGTAGFVAFTLPENNCYISSGNGTITANGINCSNGQLNGSYNPGVPMTSGNTKAVIALTATGGPISFTTNTVNGISFSAGTPPPFLNANVNYGITLTATGTPVSTGTFNYTVTAAGQTCSFPVTFTSPVSFNCNGISNTITGPLTNGSAYSGTVTIPYTGGSGASYSSTVVGPVSGLSLTSTAGTYAGSGGNVVYTISGTYSGATNGLVSFTLPESGCIVNLGTAQLTPGSLSCGGALAGVYQNQTAVTAANTKQITVDVAVPGAYSYTTNTVSGISFSASGVFATTGPQTVTLTATGTAGAAGTTTYTINIGNQSCSFNVTILGSPNINCSGITHNLPASLVNGTPYSGTVNVPYTSNGTGSYNVAAVTISGLTLTRTAGSYSASGTVVYTLSGTFTGLTGASVNFALPDGGCTVAAGAGNYSVGSISCTGGALSGNYIQNVPLTTANTKAITINVTNPGPWTVNTGAVNGVTFSGSGIFGGINSQSALLTGSGTPAATGIFTYPVTLVGQSCSFTVTYGSVTANCAGIVNTMPTYLVNGTTYNTGTVSLPFTAGNGSAYTATTVVSNGLSLTRVAGTYDAGGGTVVYNLSGTYSGALGGTATFALPEGCNVTAGLSAFNSPDCSGLLSGTYQAGVATTAADTKLVDLNFATPGSYNFSVGNNGISFSGSGSVATAGVHTITLTATGGTPVNQGTFPFTISTPTQTCSFNVNFAPAATFNCGAITGFPNYQLVSGTTYSATITEPYTAGNGTAYGTVSLSSGNLILTRVPGTYSGTGGNVVYTLAGTYNGQGFISYTLPESGCTLSIGAAQFAGNTFSCGGILAGTYTTGVTTTSANTKTVNISVSSAGTYAVTSSTANGVTFAASGSLSTIGFQDIVLTASGMPGGPGTYYYNIVIGGQSCNFGVTYQ
jgi:hypothetical protein